MGIAKSSTWVGTTSSTIIGSTMMTVVECLRPLRAADRMCPGNMMRGARTTMSGGSQSTQESQGLMRGQSSFKVWLIETELTEKATIKIIRLEAGCMFRVPSVSAEPSEQQ